MTWGEIVYYLILGMFIASGLYCFFSPTLHRAVKKGYQDGRRGSPYRRHGRCMAPLVEVRLTLTDELVAGICTGCGAQVSVDEVITWGQRADAPKEAQAYQGLGVFDTSPGRVWELDPPPKRAVRRPLPSMYPVTEAQRRALRREMRRQGRMPRR